MVLLLCMLRPRGTCSGGLWYQVGTSVEGLFLAWERVFVVLVALILTIIGALTLLSWKVDLPHLIEEIGIFFQQ